MSTDSFLWLMREKDNIRDELNDMKRERTALDARILKQEAKLKECEELMKKA